MYIFYSFNYYSYYFFKDFLIYLTDFDLKNHHDKNESQLKLSQKQIIKSSVPFALAGFFHFIYYQSDIILVKYLSSNSQAGYYSSAVLIFLQF